MIIPVPNHAMELVQLSPVLVLRAGIGFEVQIESAVIIWSPGRPAQNYQVGEIPEAVGSQLTGKVRGAQATDNGTLRLDFESGWSAEAAADPDYEAWNVVGAEGFRVVCMPGGELAVWQGQSN